MGNDCVSSYVAPLVFENRDLRIARVCVYVYGGLGVQVTGKEGDNCNAGEDGSIKMTAQLSLNVLSMKLHPFEVNEECFLSGKRGLSSLYVYPGESVFRVLYHSGHSMYRESSALRYHPPGNGELLYARAQENIKVCGSNGEERLEFTYDGSSIKEYDNRYHGLDGVVTYSVGEEESETRKFEFLVDTKSGVTYPTITCGDGYSVFGDENCFKSKIEGDSELKVSFVAHSNEVPENDPVKFRMAVNGKNGYKEFQLDSDSCGAVNNE